VDGFSVASINAYIRKFPKGKHIADAKGNLDILIPFEAIKSGEKVPGCVIPFSAFGSAWDTWKADSSGRGVTGMFVRNDGTNKLIERGAFRVLSAVPWSLVMGGSALPAIPAGDGSIFAVKTDGYELQYTQDVSFKTAPGDSMVFGVLEYKGLVCITGKGLVKLGKDKEIRMN
jgi:hypothetical protein